MSKPLEISWKRLAPFAYGYALLPAALFCAFWVRPLWGIPLAALCVVVWYLASSASSDGAFGAKRFGRSCGIALVDNPLAKKAKGRSAKLTGGIVVVFIIVACAWGFFGGQGGWWPQETDWSARNAIYRDIIGGGWPVLYNDGSTALVYYIAYWLPPALLSKLAVLVLGSVEAAWSVANVILFFWTAAGVLLVELSVCCLLGVDSKKTAAVAIAVLVLFSGADILGVVFVSGIGGADLAAYERELLAGMHLEWWPYYLYEYSSDTTQLFWVFNQVVISWLSICAVLLERNPASYCVALLACLSCGPFAAVGLVPIMIVLAVRAFRAAGPGKGVGRKTALRLLFSPQNLLSLPVMLVFACYFVANAAVQSNGSSGSGLFVLLADKHEIALYLLFLAFEFGLLALVLLKDRKRDSLLWTIGILLIFIPLVHIGKSNDFCMRVSIPGLFVLMLMAAQMILARMRHDGGKAHWDVAGYLLCALLIVGAITPFTEVAYGFKAISEAGYEAATTERFDDIAGTGLGQAQSLNVKAPVDESKPWFAYFSG